jgi:hypothetical protein
MEEPFLALKLHEGFIGEKRIDLRHLPPAMGQTPSACPRQKEGAGVGRWFVRG